MGDFKCFLWPWFNYMDAKHYIINARDGLTNRRGSKEFRDDHIFERRAQKYLEVK